MIIKDTNGNMLNVPKGAYKSIYEPLGYTPVEDAPKKEDSGDNVSGECKALLDTPVSKLEEVLAAVTNKELLEEAVKNDKRATAEKMYQKRIGELNG